MDLAARRNPCWLKDQVRESENRLSLEGDRLFVEDRGIAVPAVAWGPRIGIRVGIERPWRAYMRDCAAVSK